MRGIDQPKLDAPVLATGATQEILSQRRNPAAAGQRLCNWHDCRSNNQNVNPFSLSGGCRIAPLREAPG
jgi:hypothetical protein